MERFKSSLREYFYAPNSQKSKVVGWSIVTMIVLSIIVFALESDSQFDGYAHVFKGLHLFFFVFFSVEYIFRLLASRNIMQYVFSPIALIDLIVILSFVSFFEILPFFAVFRVLRIFQILKFIRYSRLILNFIESFRHYKEEVRIFFVMFSMVLVLGASGMYFLEHQANPESFDSFGKSLWWALVTASSVGYGDAIPITAGGKFLAGLVIVFGLATMAVLTATITKIFLDHFFGKRMHHCAFCHYPNHDHDAQFCKNCGNKLDTEALDQAGRMYR